MRLDVYLTKKFDGELTRSQINNAIKAGNVTVNGVPVKKSGFEVREADTVDAEIAPEQPTAAPEQMPIDIIFQDEHLMIINKPRGLVVHPGNGNKSGTLLNGLLALGNDGLERAGIVHRLDKNTAGLVVVAKTAQVQSKLSAMLEEHSVERTYIGIVEGRLEGSGTIDKNIVRDERNRTLYKTSPTGGRRAVTHYKVIDTFARHSLVGFRLETGRTHQIRVHCKAIGHPIVGDPEYNPTGTVKATGQMLESIRLAFTHPITGKPIVQSIDPGEEFKYILDYVTKNDKKRAH